VTLHDVDMRPGQKIQCSLCRKMHGRVLADLDSPAGTFVCGDCFSDACSGEGEPLSVQLASAEGGAA